MEMLYTYMCVCICNVLRVVPGICTIKMLSLLLCCVAFSEAQPFISHINYSPFSRTSLLVFLARQTDKNGNSEGRGGGDAGW